jgi:hypothetical protein
MLCVEKRGGPPAEKHETFESPPLPRWPAMASKLALAQEQKFFGSFFQKRTR